MRILLLGSGGREHALAWKLSQSKLSSLLFIAPGNAGTSECGINVDLNLKDFNAVGIFCIREKIEMVVVGPEEPLVDGIIDFFRADKNLLDISLIGPSKDGARLEGSKSYAKSFMQRNGIPTAAFGEFDISSYREGIRFISEHTLPVVVKADGLAAGKGVLICKDAGEALAGFESMIKNDKFGNAGSRVVVEEYLDGIELSVFALTDGKNYVLLPEAKDYKRVGEGDSGLNTGGMGAVSPVPFADKLFMKKIEERIIRPTIDGMARENINYQGFIFFGLIKVGAEPFLIEYNCRLGDPETEVVIPRLKNDLVELFSATAEQRLDTIKIEIDERTACTVVAVSGGYPGAFSKGYEINGLEGARLKDTIIFHAATQKSGDKVLSNGGRVFCVTSFGVSVTGAVKNSIELLRQIYFENMYYRNDIGYEFK